MTWLEVARRRRDLTQVELANKSGMGLASYQAIESGRLRPSPGQRAKLRAVLRISNSKLDELLSLIELPAVT
jgi:transcriptional regulator with XRE-family HTH domain